MAISRKPRPTNTAAVDVKALINKGGSPPETGKGRKQSDASIPMVVRVPRQMMEEIDAAVKARPIPTARHTWVLEALHARLAQEKQVKGDE